MYDTCVLFKLLRDFMATASPVQLRDCGVRAGGIAITASLIFYGFSFVFTTGLPRVFP